MKRTVLGVMPLLLLSSCFWSKNPSSYVGSWKAGEQGFFSSAVVLILKGDGTAEINTAVGIFGSTKAALRWTKEGDKLILENLTGVELTVFGKKLEHANQDSKYAKSQSIEFTILGKTDTTMTLRGPDGSITTYTRIGDTN